MLDEQDFIHRSISINYCKKRFAHYGALATLPLITALVVAGDGGGELWERFNPWWFHWRQETWEASLKNLNLSFEGQGFFNYQDYLLFWELTTGCYPLTEAQIEQDRLELRRLDENTRIIRPHAESLLKAIEFWKLWYDKNYEDWMRLFNGAFGTRSTGDVEAEEEIYDDDKTLIEDEDYSSL